MNSKIATITLNPAVDHTVAIPGFQADRVNQVTWDQIDPGGKGVNVASFLSDFVCSVTVSGFLGEENAKFFQDFFAQKKIDDRFVLVPGKTRVNIKVIDPEQQQVTDINFSGHHPSASSIAELYSIVDQLMLECNWFVLSGSLPHGVPLDIYATLIKCLKAGDKTVVLDASGESLRQAVSLVPYAIKPNLRELQELVGKPLESQGAIVQAAHELIDRGIHSVVISMGAEGAIFAEKTECLSAHPPNIEVVSTVGAGDAMVAGLIVGKLQGLALADCARLATAFSMGALSQVGPRLPPQETIASFMSQVKIIPLE
jgi:1-phosphofructokinase